MPFWKTEQVKKKKTLKINEKWVNKREKLLGSKGVLQGLLGKSSLEKMSLEFGFEAFLSSREAEGSQRGRDGRRQEEGLSPGSAGA